MQLRPQLHTVQDPRTRVLPCQGLRSQSLIFGCLEKEKYNESIYYLENRQGHLMVTVGKGLLRNGKMRLNELCSFTREVFSTKLSLPVKARSVQDRTVTNAEDVWDLTDNTLLGPGESPPHSDPSQLCNRANGQSTSASQRGSATHHWNSLPAGCDSESRDHTLHRSLRQWRPSRINTSTFDILYMATSCNWVLPLISVLVFTGKMAAVPCWVSS